MKTSARLLRSAWIVGTTLALGVVARGGEPYQPASDATVLVRLPAGLAVSRPGMSLGEATNAPAALTAARALVLAAHREGDPRLLSRALAELQPWETAPELPEDFALVRAQIRQGLHEFSAALADLDQVLRRNPRHAGAWLMKATLHQVQADYPAARHACLQLARFADPLTATTAAAALAGIASHDDAPIRRLRSALESSPTADSAVRAWSWTTLGELEALHGDLTHAEGSLRTALQLEPGAPYPLAALADVLLDAGRTAEVPPLLAGTRIDALRLRLAEAEHRLNPRSPTTSRTRQELAEAFDLARRRQDDLHLREHARFLLRVVEDPAAALPLARRNWEIQKEPADLRLLLEAAEAAGDTALSAELQAFSATHVPALSRSARSDTARR